MMKRNLRLIGVIAVATLLALLTGCHTYQGQLDTSVPMKEQVTVVVYRPLYLLEVDGEDVASRIFGVTPNHMQIGGNSLGGSSRMSLPVGDHQLYFDYTAIRTKQYIGREDGTSREVFITEETKSTGETYISYNFEPGYIYRIYPYVGSNSELGVSIDRKEKSQSGVAVTLETGMIAGLAKGPDNLIGVTAGFSPFGLLVDTGKVSFGPETYIGMNIGYAPDIDINSQIELYGGGMFNVFFNRNNGKATGFGVGGGYAMALFGMKEMLYLRGAFIPVRNTRISLYFDYYLKDILSNSASDYSSWGAGLLSRW